MEILNIEDKSDRIKALDLCKVLLEKRALIPVIGSGFSCGTPTDNNGTIPSVDDLQENLFFYIKNYSGYSPNELQEIKKESLSDLAKDFWGIYDRIPTSVLPSFYDYIKNNFTSIYFRKNFQESFLKIKWPYIFTLNYDTMIEDYNKNYFPIIPYNQINHNFVNDKTKVFKLHGDAKKYIETADKHYFIISEDQYINSMMDEANSDMLNELLTAFSSKSILFFGCGLSGELDLLYSSQLAIKDRVSNINPHKQAVIYISFEKKDGSIQSSFSTRNQDLLARYGVTHVFRIFSEQQSNDFFENLLRISSQFPQPKIENFLEKYSAMQCNILDINNKKSRDFLFKENLVWESIDKHKLTLPGYCVSRSKITEVVDLLSSGEPLCFVSGNFFSGKTYFLIEIANNFMSKKIYIFPSGVSLNTEELNVLLTTRNALFCFDSNSLTTAQIKTICNENSLTDLKKINSNAVIVIDASDAPMYKYIFETRNSYLKFKQFWISGIFDEKEEKEFNKKIGIISLPPYNKKETLLDYVVQNEKELFGVSSTDNYFLQPQNKILHEDSEVRIKALIMLATEIRIPAKRAIQFKIDTAIEEIIKICSKMNRGSVIEKDYSTYCGDSSGYEFVCNSKYWVIRVLSVYANSKENKNKIISNSYLSIIKDYRKIYKNDDLKFYQESQPYYFYDHIQNLFNNRWLPNSSKLMNAIYDKLMPEMSDSYQFLHQKAKGKLRTAQIQIKYYHEANAKNLLDEAVFNITRAIKLAQKHPEATNIDETIIHMLYTKGRILIEYSCISHGRVPQAVDACYDLYNMQSKILDDAYDFMKGTGNDKKSFENFKNTLITDKKIQSFEDLDSKKMEFLLKRWTGKTFIVSKKKRRKN